MYLSCLVVFSEVFAATYNLRSYRQRAKRIAPEKELQAFPGS